MARKVGGQGKIAKKPRGLSDSQALKVRSMDELIGIEAIQFGAGLGEVLTQKTSI